MDETFDGELGSFLGEAEEIVAGLYETLASIEPGAAPRQGDINSMFRATHTMKGLAGMLDFGNLQALAHRLEDLLGAVRLGRLPWTAQATEIVSQGVDHLREMLHGIATGAGDAADLRSYLRLCDELLKEGAAAEDRPELDVADEVRSAFTEYEESRLASALRAGHAILQIVFRMKLSEFARVGAEIAEALEASGEIITKMPAPGSPGGSEQPFLYLVATSDQTLGSALPGIFGDRLVSCRLVREGTAPSEPAPAPAPEETPRAEAPAEEAVPEVAAATTTRTAASVRIELQTLEEHTALVGALLVEKARLEDIARRYRERVGDEPPYPDLMRTIRDIEKKVSELQRSLMTVRLVPIGQIWSRLRRIVQGAARASGKRIALALEGGDTKLDKVIVEKLADPLIHIIRNAIDHGIESPEEREEIGKPAQGRVLLRAHPRGSQIVVSIRDDGRGIDWETVRQQAAEKRLLPDPKSASERDLTEVLFAPGFSTATVITDLSGRGVGLDVVRRNLADVNAFVEVKSVRHEGTEFVITLPITLAIFQSLIIEVEGRIFAIPLASVMENLRLPATATQTLEGRTVIQHRGAEIAVVDLGQALRLRSVPKASNGYRYFVVVGSAERRLALTVDAIRGQREIVTKPLGRLLAKAPGIAGGALVGESRMALVLDVAALVSERGGAIR